MKPVKHSDAAQDDLTPADAGRVPPWRPLLEALLDPRNIRWLLAFGAGLLVLGLVLYLYAAGVFDNPVVVAGLLGAGTLGLLFTGWAVLRRTRYQTAGRALTLLACLVLPLNLWFYHAQGLHPFTLYEQLWVAALACCALYAASAWLLRDAAFVPVLVGGVTLTSLLILGQVDGPEQFWQITHPAILLVVLGLVTLHVERAFPLSEEGPFTRQRFGLAFFWSGHVVLGLGLLLVLLAQLYGVAYQFDPWLAVQDFPAPAPLATEFSLKVLALLFVLAGAYAYLWSDLVVRRLGAYVYPAAFCLLWAEALALDLLQVRLTAELVLVILAVTALAANLVLRFAARRGAAGPVRTALRCGNALLALAFAGGALLTVSRLVTGQAEHKAALLEMLLALAAVALAAAAAARETAWRRAHVVASVAQGVLAVLVLVVLGDLTLGQKLEVGAAVLGLALLVLGHVGLFREDGRRSDLVSISLFLGSGLLAIPLSIAVVTWRTWGLFHWPDELALLAAGVLLLATGFMLRLRSTTVAGAAQLLLYLVTLLIYLPWSQWDLAAVFLMVGGGAVFLTGLLLSVYRERLLALPERVRRREGIFRVLSWR